MARKLLLIPLLAAALICLGQNPAKTPGSIPQDPHSILELAIPHYSFKNPGIVPWHLLATYRTYDDKGKQIHEGTWEYWWASANVHRSTLKRDSAERTDWEMADGRFYRKETGAPFEFFERTLESRMLDPVPNQGIFSSDKMIASVSAISRNIQSVPCIVLKPHSQSDLSSLSLSNEGRYCFQKPIDALVLSSADFINVEYGHISSLHGYYLAREMDVFVGKEKVMSVNIETIDALGSANAVLSPPADAVQVPKMVGSWEMPPSSGKSGPGALYKEAQPRYPDEAKAAHMQGVVLLGATVTAQGKLKDLEVLESPHPSLGSASVEAVKQWEYEPFLSDGLPVDTNIVIKVIFTLGG